MRAAYAATLLHRRVEAGEGDDLLHPLEAVQGRKFGEDGSGDEGRDSGNAVKILQIVSLVPLLNNCFLHGLASFFEKREDAVLGNASILLEIPLVQKIARGGGAELPVVPDERFLLRQLRGLDETIPVPLRCEEREVRGVHLVRLSFPDGVPRDLLGMHGVRDFQEDAAIRERTRGKPVVRSRAFKKNGIVCTDVALCKVDGELSESDTGVGKGGCDCRFAISIPDACNQLPLPNVNANRLIHGVVCLVIQLSKKEEKREERNRRAGLFVFGARSATSNWRSVSKWSDIPREKLEASADGIVSVSIIASLNAGYRRMPRMDSMGVGRYK